MCSVVVVVVDVIYPMPSILLLFPFLSSSQRYHQSWCSISSKTLLLLICYLMLLLLILWYIICCIYCCGNSSIVRCCCCCCFCCGWKLWICCLCPSSVCYYYYYDFHRRCRPTLFLLFSCYSNTLPCWLSSILLLFFVLLCFPVVVLIIRCTALFPLYLLPLSRMNESGDSASSYIRPTAVAAIQVVLVSSLFCNCCCQWWWWWLYRWISYLPSTAQFLLHYENIFLQYQLVP